MSKQELKKLVEKVENETEKVFIEYLRFPTDEFGKGLPFGVVAATYNKATGIINLGYSFCHYNDLMKFDKKKGTMIAKGRLFKNLATMADKELSLSYDSIKFYESLLNTSFEEYINDKLLFLKEKILKYYKVEYSL